MDDLLLHFAAVRAPAGKEQCQCCGGDGVHVSSLCHRCEGTGFVSAGSDEPWCPSRADDQPAPPRRHWRQPKPPKTAAAAEYSAGRMRVRDLNRPGEGRLSEREYSQRELAAHVKRHGVEQPLAVEHFPIHPATVFNGLHRLDAAQRAGVHDVPVVVRHRPGDPPPMIQRRPATEDEFNDVYDLERAGRWRGEKEAAVHVAVSLAELDQHLENWFHPQQLDAAEEPHPRSGFNVKVGLERRLDYPPGDHDEAPARFKVTDHGPVGGSLAHWPKHVGYEPIQHVYRGMHTDEWEQAKKQGHIKSDQRGTIADWEGTNAATDPQTAVSYLPSRATGVIAKIRVHPDDGWFTRRVDQYVRTRNKIPLDRVEAVSPPITKGGKYGGTIEHIGAKLPELHRGLAVAIAPEDHAVVSDPHRPVHERAQHLIDTVTREGLEPLGQHWTSDEKQARHFTQYNSAGQGPPGGSRYDVVLHAHHPGRQHVITDPDWREEHEVNDDEDEQPLERYTELEVHGISWRPRGQGDWTKHHFAEEQYHTAAKAGWSYDHDIKGQVTVTRPDGRSETHHTDLVGYGLNPKSLRHPEDVPAPLYHGGRSQVPVGKHIEPGHPGNFVSRMTHTYATEQAEPDESYKGARGYGQHVHEVKPTGWYGHRRDARGIEWASSDPWEVVRHVPRPGQHEAVMRPGYPNPHTHSDEWFHGTRAHPDELSEGGFTDPMEMDEGAYSQPESETEGTHWNALLGTHFTADHDVAKEFALGEHSSGANSRGGEDPWRGESRNVLHARLGMHNPKVYASEHDMDHEAYEHEWKAGNHPSTHVPAIGSNDEDERYEAEDMWNTADMLHRQYKNRKIPRSAMAGSWHADAAGMTGLNPHPVRTTWINTHPDKWGIANRFRQRLKAAGHDGIIYGNEYEKSTHGEHANKSAIVFDPRHIQVTQHHGAYEDHLSAEEGEHQQARLPGAGQQELPFEREHTAAAAFDWDPFEENIDEYEERHKPEVPLPSETEEYWHPEHLYHGTSVELHPGAMVEPGHAPNHADTLDKRRQHAYATPRIDSAREYAEKAATERGGRPHVYEVHPAHDMMPDPESNYAWGGPQVTPHPEWRSQTGFQVMREHHGARRKPLQPDQHECWKCGVRAHESEFTKASPYAPVMGLAMECKDTDACRQRRESQHTAAKKRYYHGTTRWYEKGDHITSPAARGAAYDTQHEESDPTKVYSSDDPQVAGDFALLSRGMPDQARVYEVHPTGPVEADPHPRHINSFQSEHPMKVVRQLDKSEWTRGPETWRSGDKLGDWLKPSFWENRHEGAWTPSELASEYSVFYPDEDGRRVLGNGRPVAGAGSMPSVDRHYSQGEEWHRLLRPGVLGGSLPGSACGGVHAGERPSSGAGHGSDAPMRLASVLQPGVPDRGDARPERPGYVREGARATAQSAEDQMQQGASAAASRARQEASLQGMRQGPERSWDREAAQVQRGTEEATAAAAQARSHLEGDRRLGAWVPSERIFGPTYGLDHRLFDGEHLKPDVREVLITRLAGVLAPVLGPDWHRLARVWLAGSQASKWTGPALEGNGDLDVLIGLSHTHARLAAPSLSALSDAEIEKHLNTILQARFNESHWHPPFDPAGKEYDLTGYVNHVSDIAKIKPYAAYDLTDDEWTIKPPDLPDWSPEGFPQGPALFSEARALAAQVRAVLRLPEPFRSQEAARIWDSLHAGRAQDFSETGLGWQGTANVLEKALSQAHGDLVGKLKALKYGPPDDHPSALGHGMTTADLGSARV